MLQSRDVMLMENKLDVENLDCTQDNFDFFYWFSFERRVLWCWIQQWCNRKRQFWRSTSGYWRDLIEQGESTERPHRARRPPDRLNVLTGNLVDTTSVAIVETEEPTAIKEALSFVNCMLWWQPIQSEYDSLKQCQTWDLVDLPSSKNMVGRKWVFKHKWDADGQIQQCKAFLVAHGYSRKFVLTTMKFFHVCQSLTQSVLC